jgi:hypothetical protein
LTFTSLYKYGTATIGESKVLVIPQKPKTISIPVPPKRQMTDVKLPFSKQPSCIEISTALPVDSGLVGAGLAVEIAQTPLVSKGDDIKQVIATRVDNSLLPTTMIVPEKGEYVRVATLHEGNSFIHSLLKAIDYQYNRIKASERIAMAKQFRKEMINVLPKINKSDWPKESDVLTELYKGVDPRVTDEEKKLPLNTYYFTVNDGELAKVMSKAGGYSYLKKQLESMAELPSTIFGWISEIVYGNINIYKLDCKVGDKPVLVLIRTHQSKPRRAIVLSNRTAKTKIPWKRPTLMFLENKEFNYEPIGHREAGTAIHMNYETHKVIG